MASSMEERKRAVKKTHVYNWNDTQQQPVFPCQQYAKHSYFRHRKDKVDT